MLWTEKLQVRSLQPHRTPSTAEYDSETKTIFLKMEKQQRLLITGQKTS